MVENVSLEQFEEFKKQLVMMVANANKSTGTNTENQALLDAVKSAQKMDMILMLNELLEIDNLDYVTEHTNNNYLKQVTKFETLRIHQAEHFDFHTNNKWDDKSMEDDQDKIIKPMIRSWKLNHTSLKRKRSQEIVQGLKQEAVNYNMGTTPTRRSKFLGVF